MKVFISYGDAGDQVTALRLQALAGANGLTVYVPPAYTRQGTTPLIDPQSAQKLNESDILLGVVMAGLTEACRQELNTGIALRKSTIVMADPIFTQHLQPSFGSNLVTIDPAHPDIAERSIVQHLTTMNAEQNAKKALLALGTLALGLLIFAPSE